MSNFSPQKNTRAVFFDLDNVLVFSEKIHTLAWQQVLAQCGIDFSQVDFEGSIGFSDMSQARIFKDQFNLKQEPEFLWEMKRKQFLELIDTGIESPMGRDLFLEKISQYCVIGVVSSSSKKIVETILKKEKIREFFNFVIAYEDCLRHKPDPFPYEQALMQVQITPDQALVIEDSVSGITAAKKAKIPVIGLFKEQRADQILDDVQYYHNFSEIHEMFFDVKR